MVSEPEKLRASFAPLAIATADESAMKALVRVSLPALMVVFPE